MLVTALQQRVIDASTDKTACAPRKACVCADDGYFEQMLL